jgi:hypothetical protein
METVNDISKRCQNCGAPYTGDRCGYCGTWHGDEPEKNENPGNGNDNIDNIDVGILWGVLWWLFIIAILIVMTG